MHRTKVGFIGSGFVSDIHAEAFRDVPQAEVVAVASPTEAHVKAFAQKHGIPNTYTDYRQLLERDDIEVVTLAAPNYLHCEITEAAAAAGKHVICEKPLCVTMAEADRMISACKKAGVKLMYAEELCFTPKYVRLKQLADSGALGDLYMVKQCEKHDGPHSPWFWDVEKSGGGVTLDMGCHAFCFFLWMYNWMRPTSVYADMVTFMHKDKTRGDDNATIIVNFPDGRSAIAEESWAKKGGMDDRAEAFGTQGCSYAVLHMDIALRTYSEVGYDYVVEKAPVSTGWSYTIYEELWNYGFPQEMRHFIDCVRDDREPLVTGEHGKLVHEMVFGAYASAGRRAAVNFPFAPPPDAKPYEMWLGAAR
ncbi:MAG TPA: Gfo/Idh/MocA family oxidoreductase [Armatimonadota bacterium]